MFLSHINLSLSRFYLDALNILGATLDILSFFICQGFIEVWINFSFLKSWPCKGWYLGQYGQRVYNNILVDVTFLLLKIISSMGTVMFLPPWGHERWSFQLLSLSERYHSFWLLINWQYWYAQQQINSLLKKASFPWLFQQTLLTHLVLDLSKFAGT